MLLSAEDQLFMQDCVKRIARNGHYLDCLSREERLHLLRLIDRVCAENDIPGSVYGRG